MSQPEHWFIFQNDQLLLKQHVAAYSFPTEEELALLRPHFLRQHPIMNTIENVYHGAEILTDIPLPHSLVAVPLRKALNLMGVHWYGPIIKAYSVINWDRTHQFCSRCGSKTKHATLGFEHICTSCGIAFYPRISPSIIVLIRKDDHLLMARSPHFVAGAYGLIAGFVEVGETLEETIHREVMEEVQIKVKNIQYFGSQPWPFPDSLMIGFLADYASGEIVIDNKEIEDAGWYRYDNLPGRPSVSVSIAKRLIDHFVQEQIQLKATKSKE